MSNAPTPISVPVVAQLGDRFRHLDTGSVCKVTAIGPGARLQLLNLDGPPAFAAVGTDDAVFWAYWERVEPTTP